MTVFSYSPWCALPCGTWRTTPPRCRLGLGYVCLVSIEIMCTLPPIVGTINIVQAPNVIGGSSPPHTYLGMSRQMLHGVRPLADAGSEASIPLAFVVAQAAECALKAYLSRTGDDKRLKAPALRHDLKALWELAESEGLQWPGGCAPDWLLHLSGVHGGPSYFIRYATGVNGLVLPGAQPMATEIASLVDHVAKRLFRGQES